MTDFSFQKLKPILKSCYEARFLIRKETDYHYYEKGKLDGWPCEMWQEEGMYENKENLTGFKSVGKREEKVGTGPVGGV